MELFQSEQVVVEFLQSEEAVVKFPLLLYLFVVQTYLGILQQKTQLHADNARILKGLWEHKRLKAVHCGTACIYALFPLGGLGAMFPGFELVCCFSYTDREPTNGKRVSITAKLKVLVSSCSNHCSWIREPASAPIHSSNYHSYQTSEFVLHVIVARKLYARWWLSVSTDYHTAFSLTPPHDWPRHCYTIPEDSRLLLSYRALPLLGQVFSITFPSEFAGIARSLSAVHECRW